MREIWWQFQRPRKDLYEKLKELGFAWVVAATSDTIAFVGLRFSDDSPMVFSHAVNVLALSGFGEFATVQSSVHLAWARWRGSSLKGDFRYTTTDCLENFPFPVTSASADTIGERYHDFRSQLMLSRQEGLTDTYSRFHDSKERSEDVARLRTLQVEMDYAVVGAYRWDAKDLGHDFHETKQGHRYTISESARRRVISSLLTLNHQRHAEETRSLHRPGNQKRGKSKSAPPDLSGLFR
jgi:hypothetical protein